MCREQSVGKLDEFKWRITVIPGATNDPEVITDGGQRFDLIFETAGSHSPSGTLVLIGNGGSEGRWIGPFGRLIRALVLSRFVWQL